MTATRTVARTALRAFAVVLAIAVLETAGAALQIGTSLRSAERSVDGAVQALSAGKLDRARAALLDAQVATDTAEGYARGLWAAAAVPGLERDVAAITALARAASLSVRAGRAVVDPALGLSAEGSIVGALYREGRIDIDAVHTLQRTATEAGTLLERALDELQAAPRASIGPVDEAVRTARERIGEVTGSTRRGAAALEVLPGLVGEGGRRRYLLALLNPAEARGGGGLIGLYGMLTATDGRLEMGEITPIRTVDSGNDLRVEAPAWFRSLYGTLSATREWRQANLSPTFPVAAEIWLRMYERQTGRSADGVIAMDPFVLGELSRGTGPLRSAGWKEKIGIRDARTMLGLGNLTSDASALVRKPWNMRVTPATAAKVLMHDIYLKFNRAEHLQNRYLKGLVSSLWSKLGDGDLRTRGLLRGVSRSAAAGHLRLYSRSSSEQEVFASLRVDGDPASWGPDVQMVFSNNFGKNKVDYYLDRHLSTNVALDADGGATVETAVTLQNRAPVDEPVTVLLRSGLQKDPRLGMNQMTLNFLVPQGARVTSVTVDGRRMPFFRGRERIFPVAYQPLFVGAGETSEVRISYRWPDAVRDRRFRLVLLPQTMPDADRLAVTVTAPAGSSFVTDGGAARSSVRLEGRLRRPRTIDLPLTSSKVKAAGYSIWMVPAIP